MLNGICGSDGLFRRNGPSSIRRDDVLHFVAMRRVLKIVTKVHVVDTMKLLPATLHKLDDYFLHVIKLMSSVWFKKARLVCMLDVRPNLEHS